MKRKKILGLGAVVLALAVCGAMSFAWFTSSIDPISTGVTTAKIQITGTDGVWEIGSGIVPLNKALPGEEVKTTTPFTVTNNSNREAVAKIDITEVSGTLKLANQTVSGTQQLVAGAYAGAITADTALSSDEKTALSAQITATGIVVNKAFVDFMYKATTRTSVSWYFYNNYYQSNGGNLVNAFNDIIQVEAGIKHFYDQIVAMGNNLTKDIIDTLDDYDVDYVTVAGVTYVALGIPTAANQTIDFDLSYTIPEELGGEVTASNPTASESRNWENWFNEQESTFSYKVGVKAVQGTVSAINDVFGTDVTNAFQSNAATASFLTDN